MNKALRISLKDLQILYSDPAALLLMLAAPFVLTLALGAITGAFNQSSPGISGIPLILANQDAGELGASLVEAFGSPELGGLFTPTQSEDIPGARQQVVQDATAALIIIPKGFSASLLPDPASGQTGPAAPLEIYTSPVRPNSAMIIEAVTAEIIHTLEIGAASGQVALEGLVRSGRLSGDPQEAGAYRWQLQERLQTGSKPAITVKLGSSTAAAEPVNYLEYLAPAMATFFLMYTVAQGARSLLLEREHGTLARMLTTPTSSAQVLGGKLLFVFLAGVIQVGGLVLASGLLFNLSWGSPLGVLLLILSVCLAATGWGILLASLAKTYWQIGSIGSAMMLIFGLLGGTFIPISMLSEPVRWLARITPNYWANLGFATLSEGGGLADILPMVAWLLVMAAILFTISVLAARQRWTSGFAKQ
jgi:ABC-2 type transport system permease protein